MDPIIIKRLCTITRHIFSPVISQNRISKLYLSATTVLHMYSTASRTHITLFKLYRDVNKVYLSIHHNFHSRYLPKNGHDDLLCFLYFDQVTSAIDTTNIQINRIYHKECIDTNIWSVYWIFIDRGLVCICT